VLCFLSFLLSNKLHMINGVHCLTTYDKQCYASLIWSPPPQKKHSNKEKKDPVYFHYQYLLFFMCQTQMNYEYFALHSSHDTNHWSFFLLGQWIRCHHFGGDLGFSWSEGSWFDGHENFCWHRFVTLLFVRDMCLSMPWCLLNNKVYA